MTNLRLTQSIQAHSLPISSYVFFRIVKIRKDFILKNTFKSRIAIHPRKMIAVTTSDDKSWKMWTIPDGQMIMRGDGHTDWLSGCDFHPKYDYLQAMIFS